MITSGRLGLHVVDVVRIGTLGTQGSANGIYIAFWKMDQGIFVNVTVFSLTRAWCPGVQGVAIVTAPVRVAPGAGGGVCVAQLLPHDHQSRCHNIQARTFVRLKM